MSAARPTLWWPKMPGRKKTPTRSPPSLRALSPKRSSTRSSSAASSLVTRALPGGDSTRKFLPERIGTITEPTLISIAQRTSLKTHWLVPVGYYVSVRSVVPKAAHDSSADLGDWVWVLSSNRTGNRDSPRHQFER